MITATLQEAKAKLNQLVEKARAGETVVLMRGSEIVAEIRPLSSRDLEISLNLSDRQAERFWQEVDNGESRSFSAPVTAVSFLKKSKK